ncbi:PucR C-terminal helix-turn-helix domain-containing protein [Agromyces sp. CF514]|uniref:helix-turn-helix domain-containing protein n=1 Tax=Agromyces sp. CF514 TaxID=1881031 RepID=UPI0008F314AD|nr:LysR family transcriptional regulator [Agromyces sp. CF514]SFR66812.1 PucR C-terminal helix-turn-helix domain-containing protein [Agromyces sp. CF514]
MQELVGRLTALDPEASETLKVVSYFDTLVAGGVGIESLLRGAAVLSGAVAGFAPSGAGRGRRIAPDGVEVEGDRVASADAAASAWPSRATSDGSLVWLERAGAAHANDAMVLERLALAVAITTARRANTPDAAVEVVVTAGAAAADRAIAASRLRLDCAPDVRVVAVRADEPAPIEGPTAVVATARGLVRVVLVEGPPVLPPGVRTGVGVGGAAERLPQSFGSALIALRLGTEAEPLVDAAQLGALLFVAEAADRHEQPHPDAAALAALDPRTLAVLDALADAGSVRQAASALGMHHSSVQARLDALTEMLGYDPRTPAGRTRFALARALAALQRPGLG